MKMPLHKNDIVPLEILDITSEGSGVGRLDGMAVFVPMTAVGDRLEVRITKVLKSYCYGIIEHMISKSADRIQPDCPVFKQCGGCTYRHISYEAELSIKQRQVYETLARIGGVRFGLQRIIPSPQTEHYRNKAQYPVRADASGKCIAGFFSKGSHRLVPSDECALQPPEFARIVADVLLFANAHHIPPYDESADNGLLRHIYLRKAEATGQLMVCLVINGKALPRTDELVIMLTSKYPLIHSIVLNVNTKNTNVILGKQNTTLYGTDSIEDILRGVRVALSPLSFYQVNRRGAEQLYDIAEQYACPERVSLLIDLYCGAGTIGLSMAHKTDHLIGADIVLEAIQNARDNAKLNGIDNSEFLCADASQAAVALQQRGMRPDAVILDPPRKGSDYTCLEAVAAMQPDRIVMISCNPATAARDVKILHEQFGYKPIEATAVDMFPRTSHVETVVLMSRVKE